MLLEAMFLVQSPDPKTMAYRKKPRHSDREYIGDICPSSLSGSLKGIDGLKQPVST
jgi:hypothetical protein